MRHFILGTAGHIDHGKSSLVQALTGTDPDRLPEEKARGLTIDLGFANLAMDDPERSGDRLSVGIVDVPGHADFVKNMVAGVGSINLALLVVAADDGWMPQTEEHYQILNYLGVRKAVVALTKTDLFDDIDLVAEDIKENLAGGLWEGAPVVPTSVHAGEGIDALRFAVAHELSRLDRVRDCGKPRLPVDRVFSLKGVGTVVTGTLIDGKVRAGDDLVIQPTGTKVHVRELQSHNRSQGSVEPGTRTAMNLSGLGREQKGKAGLSRGALLTSPGVGEASLALDVEVRILDRLDLVKRLSRLSFRSGREVQFHYGSGNQRARIHLLENDCLEIGKPALAQMRFFEPVNAWLGDRFVLRDPSLGVTLAGGVVLDPAAERRSFRKDWQVAFLEARAKDPESLDTLIESLLIRDKAVRRKGFLEASHFSKDAISKAISKRVVQEALVERSGWLFESRWWEKVSGEAINLVVRHHKKRPELVGVSLSKLRAQVGALLPQKELFEVLLEGLEAEALMRQGNWIRHRDHQPCLPKALEGAAERIRKLLAESLRKPPSRAELARDADETKALKFLIDVEEAVSLGEKAVIARTGFEEIRDEVVAYLKEVGQATAGEMRERIDSTRRVFLPLLEKLDEEGVTYREGDYRRLR
ncbi:MAG: selenocysteine-specific translation elongation factor [Verrucomicrobiota bacterium]